MRVLVDTHVFIWYVQSSDRLPSSVIEDILIISADRVFSPYPVRSMWE